MVATICKKGAAENVRKRNSALARPQEFKISPILFWKIPRVRGEASELFWKIARVSGYQYGDYE